MRRVNQRENLNRLILFNAKTESINCFEQNKIIGLLMVNESYH